MKKTTSVIIAFIMLFLIAAPAFASDAGDQPDDFTKYPTVRIAGALHNIYNNVGTPEQYPIYRLSVGVPVKDGYIGEKVKELLPSLAKALVTGDYTEYSEGLVDAVTPIYADFVPDENGDPRNNSGRITEIPEDDRCDETGSYGISKYFFYDDWRLSPMVQAQQLREYIEGVKAATGAEKINLYSRCEASPIALVYLDMYGSDDIAAVLMDSSGAKGYLTASYIFSGDITVKAEAVERFMNCYATNEFASNLLDKVSLFDDAYTAELILATVNLAAENHSLDAVCALLMKVLENIRYTALPQILMNSYGRLLSYWAMVDEDHFDAAKEYLLSDPKWDTFRQRVDDYYYNYGCRTEEILDEVMANGAKVQVISKYGLAPVPVLDDYLIMTEGQVATADSSWGANCKNEDSRFSAGYLSIAERAGTLKYISPDRQIDASTCLIPDQTWFVKNASHNYLSDPIIALQTAFLRSGGTMTVFSDPDYPQYMLCDEASNTLVPLTAENVDVGVLETSQKNAFTAFFAFIKALFAFIKYMLGKAVSK